MFNSFAHYLHFFSCSLIFIGFSAILITRSYFVAVLAGVFSTLLYAIFGEKLSKISPAKSVWNILAIVILGYLVYQSFYGDMDLIGNAIYLVIYLQIVKILSPKENRDWYQIYLLSFLHIVAATTISSDMSFALPFFAYLILAVWTLTLFNIKVQQESSTKSYEGDFALKRLLKSKDLITLRFFAMTSFLSLFIILIALIIFFIFPRVSMKNFLRRVSPQQDIAGYSGEVELGTIGKIQENNSIAFRVELPENSIDSTDIEELYWRGTASDFFDGKKWSQTFSDRKPVYIDIDDNLLKVKTPEYPGEKIFTYSVLLEALTTPILFASDRLIRVTWDKPFVEKFLRRSFGIDHSDEYGSFHFQTTHNFASDLTYKAESMVGNYSEKLLRDIVYTKIPYRIRESYLQMPDLNPDVAKLVGAIPVRGDNVYDRAKSIQAYIEKNYTYTTNVQDKGTSDPMRFFFIEKKKGHCGYFSTALILALRYHGIPARQVIGFRGGEYNAIGNYLAIKQNHAHGWAEVYFEKYGWIRFDPSPLTSELNESSAFVKSFLHMLDYLRLRWNKYIIEYDLRSQASFIEKIGRQLTALTKQGSTSSKNIEADVQDDSQLKKLAKKIPPPVAVAFIVFFIAVGVLSAKYGLRRQKKNYAMASEYKHVLKLLSQNGFNKKSTQTIGELSRDVEKKLGDLPSLKHLTRMYYDSRFGSKMYAAKDWRERLFNFKKTIALAKKALRGSKK